MRVSSPATPTPRTRLSACSSRPLKLFGKACPREGGGQGRQAHRIRQNRQIAGGGEPDRRRLRKATIGGPATRTCCLPRSKRIKQRWAARRTWWRRMPASPRPTTRRPRKPRASSASASPTAPPRALSAKREQKKRWFRNGQKWRTACEGRISVVKRRHGLGRSRYKGEAGIRRWVGLGVIADNLVNISRAMAKQPSR